MSNREFIRQIRPLRDRLYRLALLLGRKPVEAEDIVQETLARYWARRHEVVKPQAWCYQLVRRLAIDQWRQNGKYRDDKDLPDQAHPEPDPLERTTQREDVRLMLDFLRQLPEKQQQVFQLRELEGLSYREIADTLELPLNQVKINLHRARTRIRARLEKIHAYGNP